MVQSIDTDIENETLNLKVVHTLVQSVMKELNEMKQSIDSHESFMRSVHDGSYFSHSADVYDSRDTLVEHLKSFAENGSGHQSQGSKLENGNSKSLKVSFLVSKTHLGLTILQCSKLSPCLLSRKCWMG